MISKTKGIVLRNVKYGETSVVVTMFTELFGVQTYLVNGVRTASKRGSSKASFFQPSAILELIAYHNEFNQLQRLKEFKWDYLFQTVFSDVRKNAVALFMVELLTKCLKQPEAHPDLFYFSEDALHHLDKSSGITVANFPLFFALHLTSFLGCSITHSPNNNYSYLDLREGVFTGVTPNHHFYLSGAEADVVAALLQVRQPAELQEIPLTVDVRRSIMQAIEQYYALHISDFGSMKTLPVLREVLS